VVRHVLGEQFANQSVAGRFVAASPLQTNRALVCKPLFRAKFSVFNSLDFGIRLARGAISLPNWQNVENKGLISQFSRSPDRAGTKGYLVK
jgi:hypothetical protein